MQKIGIILINYKEYAKQFLNECRESLEKQSFAREQYNVYIVDNASSEESFSFLEKSYPQAIIIPRKDGNYSAGNNTGIEKAKADGCELFVIANMDTKFDFHWLEELVKVMQDKSIGIAQSKVLLYSKNEVEKKQPLINTLGNKIHFLGFGFTTYYQKPDFKVKKDVYDLSGYASGCSLIVRKELLEKIGNYNEEYYMYHDDLELSWRARLAGARIVLAPKSKLFHKYEFSRSVRMLYYMERNRFLAMYTFYKIPTLILILPMLEILDVAMLLYALKGSWLKTKIKVYLYFLKPVTWKKILQTRKHIDSIRELKDKDIVKNFSGELLFTEIDNPILRHIGNPMMNLYWKIVRKIIVW